MESTREIERQQTQRRLLPSVSKFTSCNSGSNNSPKSPLALQNSRNNIPLNQGNYNPNSPSYNSYNSSSANNHQQQPGCYYYYNNSGGEQLAQLSASATPTNLSQSKLISSSSSSSSSNSSLQQNNYAHHNQRNYNSNLLGYQEQGGQVQGQSNNYYKNNRMSHYPPELAMLGPWSRSHALMAEKELEDMVQVQLSQQGDSEINCSEINLYSRFSADTGLVNQRRDQKGKQETFEFMNRQTRPMPMPMPGINDPPQREPDYLDTPYQLKTLGPSLSSYMDYDEATMNLTAVEGIDLNDSMLPLPPNNNSFLTNSPSSETTIPHCSEDVEVKQSDSSESQAYYGTENVVRELKMEYVRWFYKTESDKNWLPFTGYDSMRIESRHRELVLREEEDQMMAQQETTERNSGTDFENSYESTERRQNVVNSRGYLYQATTTAQSNTPVDPSSSSHKQHTTSSVNPQPDLSSSTTTTPSKGNSSSRTKRVYRTFTRKWLEWSGPNVGVNGSPKHESSSTSSSAASASSSNRQQWPPVPAPTNSDNIIIVRGGLYEVDLEHMVCYATYWPDLCQVCRGTWFYDGTWQPIDSIHADKLEIEHLEKFGGASLVTPAEVLPESPTKKNKQVAHRVSFTDFHVDWTSATEIHLYSKAVFKMSSILQILSLRGGHRICRGYFKQCMLSDRPAEINHIVFVVHGIGQKMDTGRIVRNCAAFRECVSNLKKQLYPQSEGGCQQKAEFFPVEWRSAAKLDGDIVDAITPHKLLGLRQMLNATAMDIMYYTSPLYRTEIQNALRSELNRIYSNFVKRNPEFEARGGKVSVLAHSLGVVITYDIMTSTVPELRSIELNGVEATGHSEEINHEGILVIDDVTSDKMPEQPRLLFKLEHFLCLGSPLAVFLALRWKEPHNPALRSYIFPPNLCKRVYNIFHPSDPVAYRLEPLLNKHYIRIAPLLIHSSGSLAKPKYDEMEKELINRDLPSQQQQPTKFDGLPLSSVSAYQPNEQQQPTQSQPNSLKSTPQRFNMIPVPSSYSSNSTVITAVGSTTITTTSAVFNNNSSLKSPPTPLTPSKDSNWSWFNLMKYWKSPENQNEFNEASAMSGSPPEFINEMGQQQQGYVERLTSEPDSPESSINYVNSPHGLNHQGEYRREVEEEPSHSVVPPVPNDLEYRMDFVLRESNLSSSYLAALTSHTSYWTTPDVALFLLDILETSK